MEFLVFLKCWRATAINFDKNWIFDDFDMNKMAEICENYFEFGIEHMKRLDKLRKYCKTKFGCESYQLSYQKVYLETN